MKSLSKYLLLWLAFAAILGGHPWSPPGGFTHALAKARETQSGLLAPHFRRQSAKKQ